MKAKILLTGLVAPMVFAACTQEEAFVPQQEAGKIDLSNRPTLGKVALGFGDQTRATLNDEGYFNSLKWTDTDAVGARLIDEPNDNFGKNFVNPIWQYDVCGISYTNYKYEKGAGTQWVTDALMVEGNYMFYAPYDGKALYRDPLKMKFPVAQTIDTEAELMEGANTSAIKEFFEDDSTTTVVGYKFLSSKGQEGTISPEITHLHAYPQITLKNSYFKDADKDGKFDEGKDEYQDITIKQIIIANSQFKENLVIDQPELKKALQDYVAKVQNQSGYENNVVQLAGSWTDDVNFLKNARTSNITNPGVATSKDGKIVITFEPALEIAAEGEFKFHAVLPAEYFAKDALQFTVIMPGEDRDQTFAQGDDIKTFGNAVALTYSPGKRYAKEEYDFEEGLGNGKGYEVKESAGTLFTIDINGSATKDYVAPVTDIDVLTGTGEDVNSLEKFLQELNNNDRPVVEGTDFTFATYTEGDNKGYSKVVFNKAMVDILNKYLNGANGTITFTTPMLISDELKGNYAVGAKYTFGAVKQIDNKEIVFKTNAEKATFNGKVTLSGIIKNEAKFNGQAILDNANVGKTTINGASSSINGTSKLGDVEINANTTIAGTAQANSLVINNATVTYNDANNTLSFGPITVQNNATLNMNKTYANTITVGAIPANSDRMTEGTLNINKSMSSQITLNKGNMTIAAAATISSKNLTWGNDHAVKLTNNGKITDGLAVPAQGTYVHVGGVTGSISVASASGNKAAGIIENNADITVNENNGTIKAMSKSTHTTVKGGNGTIVNDVLAYVNVEASPAQTVSYTFDKEANQDDLVKFKASTYSINKYIFAKKLSINEIIDKDNDALTGVKTLEFKNGLYVNESVSTFLPNSVTTIEIGSKMTIGGFEKSLSRIYTNKNLDIKVAQGVSLTVEYITMATYNNEAIDIKFDLADGASINVNDAQILVGKAYVPYYTSSNEGSISNGYFKKGVGPQEQNMTTDGTTYKVYSKAGLLKLVEAIEADANDFQGKTVLLMNNINLNNEAWTPIAHFLGTFDGQGKTISNLKVSATGAAGFIANMGTSVGTTVIQNLNIDGAEVTGTHWVGAIAGGGYGAITNCIVTNAKIYCKNPKNGEDGDKAGAVIGFHAGDNIAKISDCQVKNSTVEAGRDAGQVVGAAKAANVVNCSAVNTTVSANGTANGENILNEVVGRKLK